VNTSCADLRQNVSRHKKPSVRHGSKLDAARRREAHIGRVALVENDGKLASVFIPNGKLKV
jgi:hypothetical protein